MQFAFQLSEGLKHGLFVGKRASWPEVWMTRPATWPLLLIRPATWPLVLKACSMALGFEGLQWPLVWIRIATSHFGLDQACDMALGVDKACKMAFAHSG
jgi:hypothetical protein